MIHDTVCQYVYMTIWFIFKCIYIYKYSSPLVLLTSSSLTLQPTKLGRRQSQHVQRSHVARSQARETWREIWLMSIHPWRLTWNITMEVWKIIFLSKWEICRFHVNLQGCNVHTNQEFGIYILISPPRRGSNDSVILGIILRSDSITSFCQHIENNIGI